MLEMRLEFVIDKLHVRDNLLTNPNPAPKYHIFDKDETSAQNQSSEPGTGPNGEAEDHTFFGRNLAQWKEFWLSKMIVRSTEL